MKIGEKIKFNDIKGMLCQDEMREIVGGCGWTATGSLNTLLGGVDMAGAATFDFSSGTDTTTFSASDLVGAAWNATPNGGAALYGPNGFCVFNSMAAALNNLGINGGTNNYSTLFNNYIQDNPNAALKIAGQVYGVQINANQIAGELNCIPNVTATPVNPFDFGQLSAETSRGDKMILTYNDSSFVGHVVVITDVIHSGNSISYVGYDPTSPGAGVFLNSGQNNIISMVDVHTSH